MKQHSSSFPVDYHTFLQPEYGLERQLLEDPAFLEGLDWGKPRFGHPEGQIYKHIREVLDNIDLLGVDCSHRYRLRVIAFVHDTFKYKEDKSYPRDWAKHHSIYARQFLEQYTDDPALLMVTELHDEAYHCWCLKFLHNQEELYEKRLKKLLTKLDQHLQLYYLFFKCDTRTGDKNMAPLKWFEANVPNIVLKNF
jgi:hypothetical protein